MQNFLIGLCIGVALAIVLAVAQSINAHKRMKALMAEKDKLRQMITDRIDLESEGLAKLKKENEELKKQNENLRVTVSTYSQRPGRKEVARLQVYQLAVDRLTLNSPGFGAAWQAALKESEDEFQKTYIGVQPFLKKIIPFAKSEAEVISIDEPDEKDKKNN